MRRRLFTAVSVLSLVLCLVTLVLWVRSYYHDGGFRIIRGVAVPATGQRLLEWDERELGIICWQGSFFWSGEFTRDCTVSQLDEVRSQLGVHFFPVSAADSLSVLVPNRFGFGYAADRFEPEMSPEIHVSWWRLRVPIWLITVTLAILPMVGLPRRVKGRSHCQVCGYNLTGNTSGVCPECGTPTAAGVKA
jgi:hypothetical protein